MTALLLIQAAGVLLALWTGSPPPVVGADAQATMFSGERTRQTLVDLMGDGRPRPTGSDANAAARNRIVARLTALGYEPEVQTAFVCGPFRHYCAEVHNVIARVPGRAQAGVPAATGASSPAVLVNAHYDSQAATPGAADCLAGVASVLEMASIFRAAPPTSDVILLLNDGEEAGLLGATAFVEEHRWARDVRAVVNLEARGSGGPSWPVYSIGNDLDLMRAYLDSAVRPAPGSAALAATAGLPLANDIAIFDRLGVPGFTMGFARHPRRYHTPRDDLAHLSLESLQQHGGNAVALVRALAHRDGTDGPGAQGVFVAIGPVGLAWPASWSMPIWLLAAAVLIAGLVVAMRRRAVTFRQLLWGLSGWPIAVLLVFFGAAAVNAGRRAATDIVSANVSAPLPSFLGFCLLGLGGILLTAPLLNRLAGRSALGFATWIWWTVLAGLAVEVAPQAAYVPLVPLVVAAVASHALTAFDRRLEMVAVILPAATVALIWYPHMVLLYDLLGIGNLPPMAGLVAIAATAALPIATGRAVSAVALATVLAGLGLVAWGTRVPTFTADHPQFANLIYHLDADRGDARWAFTGWPLPGSLADVAPFGAESQRLLSWSPQDSGLTAPAPPLDVPVPRLDQVSVERRGSRTVLAGRIVSPRHAPVVQLVFTDGAVPREVRIAGIRVPPDAAPYPLFDPSARVYTIWTMPSDGIEVVVEFDGEAPESLVLVDRSYGLPPDGAALIDARPAWSAPVGSGDFTIVSTTVRVNEPSPSAVVVGGSARP